MVVLLFLFVGSLFLYGECTVATSTPPISVLLKAHWGQTPLALEASEYIAEMDEKLFWQFLWQLKDMHQSATTDKECYDAIIKVAMDMLPSPTNHLLSVSLALHTHSPTVQMFQQVSSEVHVSLDVSSTCDVFVTTGANRSICDSQELKVALNSMNELEKELLSSDVQPFDHCYPFNSSLPTVFLYGELGTEGFSEFIDILRPKMESGQLRVCVRHWLGVEPRNPLILSGYGVQLAIKSTEYKAMDDRKINEGETTTTTNTVSSVQEEIDGFNFTRLKERYSNLGKQLEEFQNYLLEKRKDLPQLKAWEISDLGLQSTQVILESEFPFNALQDISHNLPLQAKALSRIPVQKELKNEITYNHAVLSQVGVSPGDSLLLLNGLVLQEDDLDTFSLLERIKKESRLLAGLQGLGIPSQYFTHIISLPVHPVHSSFAVDMRDTSVIFLNDIEKDRSYYLWPSSVAEFLRPTFPGTLRQIRKNAFTIVFIVDPLSTEGLEYLQYISLFFEHLTPFRLGVLFVHGGCGLGEEPNTNDTEFMSAFNTINKEKGVSNAFKWALDYLEDRQVDASIDVGTSLKKNYPSLTINFEEKDYNKASCQFYLSRGFSEPPLVLVNGVLLDLEDDDLQTAIVTEVQRQTTEIQQKVFKRLITDSTNIYDYFMSKPNVLLRLNKHVNNQNSLKIDLSGVWSETKLPLTLLTNTQLSSAVVNKMNHLCNEKGEFNIKLITVWIIADLSTPSGRRLALDALTFMSTKDTVRVGLLHNSFSSSSPSLPHILVAILKSQRSSVAINAITNLLLHDNEGEELMDVVKQTEKFKLNQFEQKLQEVMSSDIINYQKEFINRVLQLEPGQSAILSNGRLIGPLSSKESFGIDDYEVLYQFESSSYAQTVSDAVNEVELILADPDDDTTEYRSDLVMKLSSLLRAQTKSRRLDLSGFSTKHSVLSVAPTISGPIIQCLVFLNPLSSAAQKIAPLISKLKDVLPLNVTVIFNPVMKLSELPLKVFYRTVIDTSLSFDSSGHLSPSTASAVFTSLPSSPLFTLNMDVPHSWMVEAVYSPYDLDNIHLASVEKEVHAEFRLEYIIVEGQCFDAHMDTPIPGLQYVMGTDREPALYDTIVMANLGYFQLKGKPGAWKVKLREGRSSDIYQITSYQPSSAHIGDGTIVSIPVTVASFTSTLLLVRVTKRKGMEKVNLLQDTPANANQQGSEREEKGGIFDSISKFFSGNDSSADKKGNDSVAFNETINIFSIASGHLYERFLRIMMLSVLKHTKHNVKFWFLKNYLSPQFKDFIPKMADKYGFEYELVQYKWPRWLHKQTEKQRLIWGYKILFLDVLFPLNIKKIIFVDADQVVRTDMKELLEVPLDGAPYGYTPFCDSRKDMDGFRFWKSGYWRNHLGRRAYHISALYVIDLQRFRLLAAGDRLRGQYQMLSQDPNSLSNLDQDLPNSMIHNVPIKSLPQDWLWCETWCSMESKPNAKTIDLCNNPLTKEPKLTSAVRIIEEWQDYDNEIKQLQEVVTKKTEESSSSDKKRTHSHQEL